MATYILKRILLMIPTLIGITIITFCMCRIAPGDPVEAEFGGSGMGGGTSAEGGGSMSNTERRAQMDRKRKEFGLDKPLHIQYLVWVGGMFKGDFGRSIKYKGPFGDRMLKAMGTTVQLNVISILLVYLISIPLGIHSAMRRGKPDERVAGVTLFGLYSAPSFWVATILLLYFANPGNLYWFDGVGLHSEGYERLTYLDQIGDWLQHLVLPVICLTYASLASMSRFARAGLLDTIRKDYVRTARAKGLPERVVILKHALRNSLIPIVTIMASLLPSMIGGSIVIEYIFTINGMGKLSLDAIVSRDYNIIMATATLSAVLTLVGMLLSDILYTFVDPRISLDK